jgi:hypothetical protein
MLQMMVEQMLKADATGALLRETLIQEYNTPLHAAAEYGMTEHAKCVPHPKSAC